MPPPFWRQRLAGRVDHVDNVDHHSTVASRPYRRPGACVLWTMWTIGQHVQAFRAWAVWTMWTITRQSLAVRNVRGACGRGRGFVDNVDHVDHELQVVDPLWGARAQDVRAVTTVYPYSIYFFLFLDYQHHCPHCPHSPFFIGRERGQRALVFMVHAMSTRCPIPTILQGCCIVPKNPLH